MYAEIESDRNEQSVKAVIATLVITVGIILLLMFINLYKPNPLPTEVLIELELGYGDPDAGGGSGGAKTISTPVEVKEEQSSSISTENTKESPIVHSTNNVNTNPVNTNVAVNNNTKPNNPNALFPGMGEDGEGGGKDNGKGDGIGPNNGPGFGPDGKNEGINGPGGPNWIMEGRTAISKPTITDSFEEEGKVVVNVWIDQSGAVTRTSINESQTNTSSTKLRNLAEKAAKKWKYSGSTKASIEQKGLVIYKFVLK